MKLYYLYQACAKSVCAIRFLLLTVLLISGVYFITPLFRKMSRRLKSKLGDCSLQVRVNKELEGSQKKKLIRKIYYWFSQLYLPSRSTFLILSIITLFIYFVAHLEIPNFLLINTPLVRVLLHDNDYPNLIAVTAGIGTVIFALIIFVAESLRENSERARVLLKESWLYPLTFFGVSVLLMFLWLDVTYMSIPAIVGLGFFTIFSISQMIRLLLNRTLFLKKEQGLFKDRVKESIDKALRLRIGNNIFLKTLKESDYNIDFSFFNEEKEGFTTLNLFDFGVITDINLCALDVLFTKLEELAKKNDLSFKIKQDARSVDEGSLEINEGYSETEIKKKSPIKGYLLKKLGDELDGNRQKGLIIPKKLMDSDKTESQISKLLQEVYEISSKPEESLSEQLRDELSRKRDVAVEALRSGKTGVLKEVADLYISVAVSFLEIIDEAGGGFSQKDAIKERGAIIDGWDEVNWVSKDLRLLLEEAVKTENREAISILSHVPIAISIRAISFSDHFVFQEFVQFQTLLYRLALKMNKKDLKDYLIDRSWRYLKEMADFYIGAELKEDRSTKKLENFRDFGVDIMQVFQALLKESFSKQDVRSFELFISATAKLFDHFKPSEDYPSARDFKIFLERENIGEVEKKELEKKLSQQLILERLESEIIKRKKELFFGISGWIFSKFLSTNFENQTLKEFWNITSRYLPTDVVELVDIYQRTRGFDTESFWGWDWWEMEGQPEGVASSIDISGKFDWLFAVRVLSLVQDLSKDQILNIKIEPKRDLVYLIDKEDSAVKSRFKQIASDREKWQKILSDNAVDKIDPLISLFDKVVKQQEEHEEEILASSTLDPIKVKEFYSDFVEAFYKSAVFRAFFKHKNEYKELKRQVNKKIKQWGFNQIADKEAFVKDWYVSYPDWGKHYGEELAAAEDFRIFKEISEIIPTISPDSNNLNTKISIAIDELRSKGFNPSLIISTILPGEFYRAKQEVGKFVPHYQLEDQTNFKNIGGFIGVFRYKNKDIPIIETRGRVKDRIEEVCVVDVKKLAMLVQHQPYILDFEKQFQQDIFIFRVVDLNSDDELRQKIINQDPDWLKNHSEPEKYLRQKVVTNILERIELRVKNKSAGLKFTTTEDEI